MYGGYGRIRRCVEHPKIACASVMSDYLHGRYRDPKTLDMKAYEDVGTVGEFWEFLELFLLGSVYVTEGTNFQPLSGQVRACLFHLLCLLLERFDRATCVQLYKQRGKSSSIQCALCRSSRAMSLLIIWCSSSHAK